MEARSRWGDETWRVEDVRFKQRKGILYERGRLLSERARALAELEMVTEAERGGRIAECLRDQVRVYDEWLEEMDRRDSQ